MPPPTSFSDLVPGTGYLTDGSILAGLDGGFLIEPGTWSREQVRHASYTLRLGSRVEVERGGSDSESRERVSWPLTKDGKALELNPGDTALLYSIENLRLPNCVLGFTVARGLLFVETLVPENTYVDPGFTGQLYTTVTNLSNRVIQLHYGMPLARLFLYRLGTDVVQPYRSGPSIGIEQHLPSRRKTGISTRRLATAALGAALGGPLLFQVVAWFGWATPDEIIKGVLSNLLAGFISGWLTKYLPGKS